MHWDPSSLAPITLFIIAILHCLTACQPLPAHNANTSFKLQDTQSTYLARKVASSPLDDGESTFHALSEGTEAFAARIALIRLAEKSLDLQYYIWATDQTGNVLKAELLAAAERGVRVRLLLDDFGPSAKDPLLLALHQHPNIEVRLFNPIANRNKRLLHLAANFNRINRRMHNKSLTADNSLSIIGGRNIGNEYFDAYASIEFADLDLLIAGSVVDQISDSFDLYWNYPLSYPIDVIAHHHLSDSVTHDELSQLHRYGQNGLGAQYTQRLMHTQLASRQDDLIWYKGQLTLLFDHPSKARPETHPLIQPDKFMIAQLPDLVGSIQKEMMVVSAYFVPGQAGVKYFAELVAQGVDVVIITNSLAATDVKVVHAGYAKYRKALLKAGVRLYELRALTREHELDQSQTLHFEKTGYRFFQSSKASLHAKSLFFDRKKTFVTSMNFDPRSFHLNTEVGIMVDHPEFTEDAIETLYYGLKQKAYRLTLDDKDKLQWQAEDEDGSIHTFSKDPHTTWYTRLGVQLLALLPIEPFL